MRILVCSKVSIPARDRTLPAWEYLRSLGHEVVVEHPGGVPAGARPDALISMGVSIMDETFAALERFPGVPLFCYHWDCYSWVWTNPRPGEYDYARYGELLRRAEEVWVPSRCTKRQALQWWSLPDNRVQVILASCPWWDHPDVRNDGYALCTLRRLPDEWCPVFEECCAELKIAHRRTDHQLSYEGYQDAVAGCKFLVNHFKEASTGGLTLMEGYRLGKPVLCSDSEWNGAADYFGGRAVYFRHGDRDDFKQKLLMLYHGVYTPNYDAQRRYVEDNFSDVRMVTDMLGRMTACVR